MVYLKSTRFTYTNKVSNLTLHLLILSGFSLKNKPNPLPKIINSQNANSKYTKMNIWVFIMITAFKKKYKLTAIL